MGEATMILRRSIHTFLQQYQLFTSILALISFPFSLSILISQAIIPSSSSSSFSILPTIQNRIQTLFDAAGFPPSSQFFTTLTSKLSQTISSYILTLPFTLSFLLFTKASIFQALTSLKNPSFSFSSSLSLYPSLLLTHLFNSLLILSANATVFTLLFITFNFLEGSRILVLSNSPKTLGFLSAISAVIYSIVIANAIVICNMALVLCGVEKSGGYLNILKACLVIRGRATTALFLALPVSLGLAAVEALFQYRVVRVFHFGGKIGSSMVLEGFFIAYLYSILVVIDTVVNFMFFKSCKLSSWGEISDEENGGYKSYNKLKEVS